MSRADGWRLRVSHETRFDYGAPARSSYNELRLTPRSELRQTALEARIATVPPAPQYAYLDYWGTHVVAFDVDRSHDSLTINGNALVDTQPGDEPEDCTWQDVTDASSTMSDHLSHNLYTNPAAELVELSARLRAPRPLDTARRVIATAHASLRYARGGDNGPHVCQRGLHRWSRSLPGLRAPLPVLGPDMRTTVPVRLGLLPSRPGCHCRRRGLSSEPCLGGILDRGMVGLRPDQRLSDRNSTHRYRPRSRLRGCAAGQGHLRGERGTNNDRGGSHDEDLMRNRRTDATHQATGQVRPEPC